MIRISFCIEQSGKNRYNNYNKCCKVHRREAAKLKRFGFSGLAAMMTGKVSSREVERIVDSLGIQPEEFPASAFPERVTVAAVQIMHRRYTSLAEYIFDTNLYIADAVNRRAHLICFPAWAGMLPLSFCAPSESVAAALHPHSGADTPDPEAFYNILAKYCDLLFDAFSQTMSQLAARHRVCLLAGTAPFFEGDDLVQRALLFNSEGELAGYQDKLSLTPWERDVGFLPGDELRVFESPAGTVSILSGSDADYFELARIAKNLGAQILLSPRAFLGEYTPMRAAMGLNMRVQETRLYGVQSVLTGNTGLGFALEGSAQIFAPNELVRAKNGIIAQTKAHREPDLVTAPLSLQQLEEIQNPYTQDKNGDLLRKHIDRLY